MYNERVWSIRSIRCHTSRGTSRHKSSRTSRFIQVEAAVGSSRTQELRHKSVHYRHTSRSIDVRVEVLVSTGVEAQVCTSRGTRHTSRGTMHTSRGTRHTSRGVEAPSTQVEALSISIRVYGRERQQVHRHTTIHRRQVYESKH